MLAEFHLDGLPPTINHYYLRTGRTIFRKTEARAWQKAAEAVIMSIWGNRPAYAGIVKLRIIFEVRTRRKWDMDNRIKPLQDCLEHAGVIVNDNQVEMLHVERRKGNADMTHVFLEDY